MDSPGYFKTLAAPTSINNHILLSEYVNAGQLKREVQHGIAMVAQKITLHGLTVLMDTKLSDGTWVTKGSKAYIKESQLHTAPWAKATYQAEGVEGKFIIVDIGFVEFIAPPVEGALRT